MSSKVVCSICSKKKNKHSGNMRAQFRYMGSHIKTTAQIAKEEGLPFYILSGVHGLVYADESIPYYDHLLQVSEVDALAIKILVQLRENRIDEVRFYTKTKPAWVAYTAALEKATKAAGVKLSIEIIQDDA